MWSGVLPDWIPFYGGSYFTFFDPVFNIADMAISTGIGILIFFNKRAFKTIDEKNEEVVFED
jgi:signal peptidase II